MKHKLIIARPPGSDARPLNLHMDSEEEAELERLENPPPPVIVDPEAGPSTPPAAVVVSLSKQAKRPRTMASYLHKAVPVSHEKKVQKLLLELMVKYYLPLHIVDSPELRSFTKSLNENYKTLDRKTFSNQFLTSTYNDVKDRVKAQLEKAVSVAATTDSWTSCSNEWLL